MTSTRELEDMNEEFNNFMHRVNEVSNIVKKLGSKDKQMQEIGTLEADQYLGSKDETVYENLCEDTVKLRIKTDRTLINKKALMKDDDNQDNMSQEAFMDSVSKDADRRYKEKLIRKEKSETFKTQGNKAFRRGEYERALCMFDKAIEQIKDSCLLYTNRALTQLNLQRYEKAVEDAEKALYWNENSLKARMLLIKAHFLKKNMKEFYDAIKEAKEKNKDQLEFINEFVDELIKSN